MKTETRFSWLVTQKRMLPASWASCVEQSKYISWYIFSGLTNTDHSVFWALIGRSALSRQLHVAKDHTDGTSVLSDLAVERRRSPVTFSMIYLLSIKMSIWKFHKQSVVRFFSDVLLPCVTRITAVHLILAQNQRWTWKKKKNNNKGKQILQCEFKEILIVWMFTSGMGHVLLYECKDNQKWKLSNTLRFYKAPKTVASIFFPPWLGCRPVHASNIYKRNNMNNLIVSKYGTNIYSFSA